MRGRMSMITVFSAEFQRNFGLYQDKALTEPVAITRNGRERLPCPEAGLIISYAYL